MELTRKKGSSFIGLKRLGICMLTVLIVIVYASAVVSFNVPFYLPIGIIILSSYSWLIATQLPSIYPMSGRAIGHLILTFLIIALSPALELNRMAKLIESGQYKYSYLATDALVYSRVAGMMVLILCISYLVTKYKNERSRKYDK